MTVSDARQSPVWQKSQVWQTLLQGVDVFGNIDCPDFFAQLAATVDEVFLPAHYRIVAQGTQLDWLYILVSGRIKFHVGSVTLVELTQGACLGERAILEHQLSPVNITTLEPCHFLILSQQDVLAAIQTHPCVFDGVTANLYAQHQRLSLATDEGMSSNVLALESCCMSCLGVA